MALATSLVLLLALTLHATRIRPVVRAMVGIVGMVYVLSMAWARVATGQHLLTDVVGGISMGLPLTLAAALALTA